MIPHAKKLLTAALLLLVIIIPSPGSSAGYELASEKVLRVIDGDTVEISGANRVRLLGIDAPEKGEPLYNSAAARLQGLTTHENVTLEVCEDRDKYGRMLATVSVDRVNVNKTLLLEGLALPMLIPPCGRPVAEEILSAAAEGALSGKGLYSLKEFSVISHLDADDHIGKRAAIRGKVVGLHKGKTAWHLNFGRDWKTDFTAVLFRDGQRRFSDLGIDPAGLVGTEVLVIGKLKRYNGPEIIIRGPDQILPLEGSGIQN